MRVIILTILTFAWSLNAWSAGAALPPMDHIKPDISNQESMQRGLTLYTNYCLGCHSMEYSRYERVATDLGIPLDIYEENLLPAGEKIGQLMKIAMPKEEAKVWFGNPPPDLTLSARLRGPDWIYNYMRAFYLDPKRPYGVNNTIYTDVGMPHVLADLQGVCADAPEFGVDSDVDSERGNITKTSGCETYAVEGVLSPEEYNEAIYDLVNFLEYVGEPSRLQSEALGIKVLIFLAFMFIFVYFLNKEYWRGIH